MSLGNKALLAFMCIHTHARANLNIHTESSGRLNALQVV